MNVAVASSSSFLLQEPAMKDAELSDSSTSSTFSGIKKSNPIINSVENINCVNTPKTDGSYCAHPNIERQQENITTTLLEKSDETIASPPPSPSPEKETEKLQVTNSISNSLTDEESSFSGELSSLTVCEDKDSPPNSTIQNDESSSVDNVQSSLKNEASENSNNNNNKGNRAQFDEGSDRTSSLIKKQLSEIEREIGRRVQNKNLKKMDENEMTQLLIDHGFGNFVEASSQILVDKSALPSKYFPPDESPTPKPTLEQLRSSFSPPTETTPAPRHFPEPASNLLHYPCASIGGLLPQNQFYDPTIPGPVNSSFSAPSLLPQQVPVIPNPTFAGYPAAIHFQGSTYNQNYVASNADMAPQPAVISPFYSTFQHLPQGETTPVNASNSCSSPSPVYASALPPTLSAITPEMATALLQQIQQYNPELISSLLKPDSYQQAGINKNSSPLPQVNKISATPPPRQFQTSSAQVHAIPCPPSVPPRASIRKHANSLKIESSVSVGEKGSTAVSKPPGNNTEVQNNSLNDPVWVMRDSYLKRLQRDEQREADQQVASMSEQNFEANTETDQLLKKDSSTETFHDDEFTITAPDSPEPELKKGGKKGKNSNKKEVIVHEPAVLIEGVLFRARYLGSTQMPIDRRQSKVSRMSQAQEAVERVKVEDGERQPSSEIDLFISTEKIMVLNTDLQRISETDVRQDILMDHSLRSISYIADIGDLVVLMARRIPTQLEGTTGESQSGTDEIRGAPRVICHVFESDEAQFIAQSIGQAFQVAYVEFLRANGIDDPNYLREINYQEVLNSQELMAEELEIFARKETQKDAVVPKKIGEPLGIVVVESGWGSMLPTVVVANLAPGGPASRSNQLNIGDQILGINGISLVGLPLAAAQQNIKNARSSTAVRLTVVSTPPVVEVRIRRPDTKYQLGFSVQNGVICSLLRGGIAERGGIRVGHRIIEINHQSVVAVPHEKIVNMLATAVGEIQMKTMPTSMFRLLTGQDIPNYI